MTTNDGTQGLQGFTQGGEGYLGVNISWRPDDATAKYAYVQPDNFILAESKNLQQEFAHIEHDAFIGNRDTDKGHRTGKASPGGPWTSALYPTNGAEVIEAAFGFNGDVAAIDADTTTGIQNGPFDAPVAPTATPANTGGHLVNGTYEYAVAYGTKYGSTPEGTATAGQVITGASVGEVALSVIPLGPVGTTKRLIYRKLGAGAFALVHTIADNTSTTWTDDGTATPGAAPSTVNLSVPANISILALTAGDANYSVPSNGRPVYVDDGSSQEFRTVYDYDETNKFLFVGLLGERDGIVITHSSAGTTVHAPGCKLDRFITRTDFSRPQTNELPLISAEDNIGGKFAYRYRGGLVGKMNIKGAPDKVMVSYEAFFSKERVLANAASGDNAPTVFDESDDTLEDLSYEFTDGFLGLESDQGSTGTPMLQRFDDATAWELDLNNNLREEKPMDGTRVNRYLPGSKRKLTLKLTALLAANYPAFYETFLARNKDFQFHAHMAINTGTPDAPTWEARTFYCPHVRPIKDPTMADLAGTVAEEVECVVRRAGGMEKIYSYSL